MATSYLERAFVEHIKQLARDVGWMASYTPKHFSGHMLAFTSRNSTTLGPHLVVTGPTFESLIQKCEGFLEMWEKQRQRANGPQVPDVGAPAKRPYNLSPEGAAAKATALRAYWQRRREQVA